MTWYYREVFRPSLTDDEWLKAARSPKPDPLCDCGLCVDAVVEFEAEAEKPPVLPDSAVRIARECDRIKAFLVEKNLAYGDSATDPIRLFSQAGARDAMLVRIDDKLSRVARGGEFPGDDTILDLIGYLILLRLTGEDA